MALFSRQLISYNVRYSGYGATYGHRKRLNSMIGVQPYVGDYNQKELV